MKCYTLSPGLHKPTQTQTNINLHEQAYSCLEMQCQLQNVSITNGCTSTLTRAIFSKHFNHFPTCGSSHHGHDPKVQPQGCPRGLATEWRSHHVCLSWSVGHRDGGNCLVFPFFHQKHVAVQSSLITFNSSVATVVVLSSHC